MVIAFVNSTMPDHATLTVLSREAIMIRFNQPRILTCAVTLAIAGSATASDEDLFGTKIGHIVMPLHDSYQVKTEFDAWLIEEILIRKQKEPAVG